jgi:hypothetical protein
MASTSRLAGRLCTSSRSLVLSRVEGYPAYSVLHAQQRRHAASSSRIPSATRPSRISPRPDHSRNRASPSHNHRGSVAHRQQESTPAPEAVKDGPIPSSVEVAPVIESAKEEQLEENTTDGGKEVKAPGGIESILIQDKLVVTRQVEMMNIFLGFEQSNKYALNSSKGEAVGYLAETEKGVLGGSIQRQVLRTHRPFEAQILDTSGNVIMIIKRPFTFINSKIKIYTMDANNNNEEVLVGEVHQIFHVIRRKYELFINRGGEAGEENLEQFAEIDEGLWAWDFMLKDDEGRPLGAISRNFRG